MNLDAVKLILLTIIIVCIYKPTMPNLDHFAQRIADKLGVGGHHGIQNQDQQNQHQQPQGPAYGNEYMYPPPVLFDSHGTGRVSKQEVVLHANGGVYPRLCRLSDGSILLGFTRFEPNPDNPKVQFRVLTVHRSTDGGATFQPHGVVDRCPRDCDNLYLLEVPSPDGIGRPKVLAAFRNHDLDPHGKHIRYRITVCESFNAGRDWKYLSQAAVKSAPNGLWEPFMRMGRRGEVQMTFSQELSRIVRTTDRGREVSVMVFETTRHERCFSVECVLSYDDGYTWGWRQVVYEPSPRGRHAGAPQIEAFADGSLAVVFMTDEDTPQDRRAWPSSASIKAVFAGPPVDGRIQWHQPAHTVQPPNCFWPGIFRVDDNTLMGVFQHARSIKARHIVWKTD